MSEPTEHLFPTRHGNWHVIDGKLVDVPLAEHESTNVMNSEHTEEPATTPHQPRPRRTAP